VKLILKTDPLLHRHQRQERESALNGGSTTDHQRVRAAIGALNSGAPFMYTKSDSILDGTYSTREGDGQRLTVAPAPAAPPARSGTALGW